MKLSARQLLTNAGSNSAAFLAQLAVTFVLAPIVLRALGDARYGAWSFVESFVAYLTLFDMGVAAALVRFAPRALAQNDEPALTRLYSAALTFFAAGGAIALAIGVVFALLFLDRCLPGGEHRGEFLGLFVILVANFAATLPLSVYPALLDGLGKFGFKSAVRTTILIVRVPLTIGALTFERRLIALGVVLTACNLLEHLILAWGVRRAVPGLRYRPRTVDRATAVQIAGYSRDAMCAMFAGRLAFHTDAFVIGPWLGVAAITPFALACRLVEMTKSVLRSATTTLTATFSRLEAVGDHDRLRVTFLAGSRAAWYAGLTAQAGLLLLGPAFLRLWIGEEYLASAVPVLLVLGSVVSLSIAQSVASRVLYGVGRLKGFARATLAEGLTNLGLSILLVRLAGIAGVAVGTAIPHALFSVYVIASVCCLAGISARTYARQIVRPMLVVGPVAVLWAWLPAVTTWLAWFAVAGAGLAMVALGISLVELKRWPAGRLRFLRRAPGQLLTPR
ncbi:MAG: oligosaccharide flippase family protein [Gemmataceae bacterium]|nr:oligosaccharide flippase family protein [Gemmataceae bacterium]